MKKTLLTALLGAGLFFGANTLQVKAQEENNPYLDEKYKTYFEIKNERLAITSPGDYFIYENKIDMWICTCPKEEYKGFLFINYYDTNENDGRVFYNRVNIQTSIHNSKIFEKFIFDESNRTINYTFEFYDYKDNKKFSYDNLVLSKQYPNITTEESNFIGEDFRKRINDIMSFQYEFNRFNPEPADKFIREQANFWKREKNENGKYVFTNQGFPIYRYFSKEEIEKIESYIQD